MNKSSYSTRPASIIKYDADRYLINFDIVEVEKEMGEETIKEYEATTALVSGEPTYPKVVEAIIRTEYSVSDEIALLRQKDTKAEEFEAYNTFVEESKVKAKAIIEG